jgi:hypothetical protein
MMKLGQKVAQDPCIHLRMILNPRALFLNRWVSGLARFHGNIVLQLQMPHQVVIGHIGCIAPISTTRNFGPILCLVHTFYGNRGKGNHIWNQKKKNIKLNVRNNILDEGYALHDEGIA